MFASNFLFIYMLEKGEIFKEVVTGEKNQAKFCYGQSIDLSYIIPTD